MITVGGKKISAAKLRETIRKVQLKKTGGMIREKGSAKGEFVILNTQRFISVNVFKSVTDTIDKWLLMQASVKDMSNEKINISNIEYIESQGKLVVFSLADGRKISTIASLYTFEEELSLADGFFKCHRSYLVNIYYVDVFS
jgi:hypothetical protein